MITKDKFIELIEDYQTYDILVEQANGIFPCIFESKLVHFACKWYEELIKSYFNFEGVDWIDAYLFDGCRKYWINDVEYPLETSDDLWELVKDYVR